MRGGVTSRLRAGARRVYASGGETEGKDGMGSNTAFWVVLIILAIVAAVVNFAIGASHRGEPLIFATRLAAGLVSVAAAAFIIFGKLANIMTGSLAWLDWKGRIIMAGIFVFAVLFIPSVVERNRAQTEPTIQQRAARPANATIRLRDGSADEWVN